MAPAVHNATPPANLNVDNGAAITTGVGFYVGTSKSIAGVSFYVPATNTGTYTVALYQSTTDDGSGTGTGTELASASIGSAFVTAGTWADVLFSSPVTCNPGQMYRAARHASSGRYVSTPGAFTSTSMTGNGITFNQTGTDPIGTGTFRNGMFREGAALAYPNSTFGAADYFVDLVLAGAGTNDAVIAGSIAGVAGTLTGDQQYPTTVVGSITGLAGSLTGNQDYPTTLAGTISGITGSLSGTQDYPTTVGGTITGLSGSLSGDQQYPVTIAGSVPSLGGVLLGDDLPPLDVVIAGNIPALGGVVTGDSLTDMILAGQLPLLAGAITLDFPAPSIVDVVLAGNLPGLAGTLTMGNDFIPFIVTAETIVNRRVTKAFIDARPTDVVLTPRERYRMSTGAWKYKNGPDRPLQVMRVIEQAAPEVLTVEDGVQRRIDYVLLAEWDAQIQPNDTFEYEDDLLEVVEVYHHNGYEIRAAVTRRLDPP